MGCSLGKFVLIDKERCIESIDEFMQAKKIDVLVLLSSCTGTAFFSRLFGSFLDITGPFLAGCLGLVSALRAFLAGYLDLFSAL